MSDDDGAHWGGANQDVLDIRDRYAAAYFAAHVGPYQECIRDLETLLDDATQERDEARADHRAEIRVNAQVQGQLVTAQAALIAATASAAHPAAVLPPPLAAPIAAPIPGPRTVKITVEQFTGDRKKTREFLRVVQQALHLNGLAGDEVQSMRFVLAHMVGDASIWAENQERLVTAGTLTTLQGLVDAINLQYRDGVNAYVAQTMLKALKMKPKAAQDYVAQFETLVADTQLPREQFKFDFRQGLPDNIHRRIATRVGGEPTDLAGWIEAVEADDALTRFYDAGVALTRAATTPSSPASSSMPRSSNTTASPTIPNYRYNYRPNTAPAPNTATRPVTTTTTTSVAAESNAMDIDANRKFRGNCYNCGKSGHVAWNCRSPKREVLRATQEELDKMVADEVARLTAPAKETTGNFVDSQK